MLVQDAINTVLQWSTNWQLPLASHKTSYLRLGTSSINASYDAGGEYITPMMSVKDLGFLYDHKLGFSKHIREIQRKAHLRTFHIFKALSTSNIDVLLKAYKNYVRPIVQCGVTVFNPCKRKDILSIEKCQNNFTRKLYIKEGGIIYSRIPRFTYTLSLHDALPIWKSVV